MKALCLIICLMLSGCSVMPYKLCSEVDTPTPLDQVNLTVHELSIWESSWHCHKLAWEYNPLMMILAFGTLPACSEVTYKDGKVEACEVWVPNGSKYLLEHELRHCMGYRDSLF